MAPKMKMMRRGWGRVEIRLLNRNIRGKIFCQVERRRQRCQFRPDMTVGNQK